MHAIKFLISLIFLFYVNKVSSQEIKKDNLYLLFKKNNGEADSSLGKKFANKKGINFNLYEKYFIHHKKLKRDTLCLSRLTSFKLTNEEDIEKKANMWRKRNEKKLKKKYGVLYRQSSQYNNSIFNTYIIEKINSEQMVIYEVKFRNEGTIR
ncbi:hypothetical protein [Tenacibaculum sp. SG-28]|uniref:hypothetical protein n=1 Tax=Tenacibaculum sp. SG-28 TaxID=754426 RepID=UPI0011B05687|nr:hypothetical protein [Tenacibaculum sp. SG-28]